MAFWGLRNSRLGSLGSEKILHSPRIFEKEYKERLKI
jgi:hypothetical protein